LNQHFKINTKYTAVVLNSVILCKPEIRKVWRYQREVIRSRQPKEGRKCKDQKKKDKQKCSKHYTENKRPTNTNPIKNRGELRCSGRASPKRTSSSSHWKL